MTLDRALLAAYLRQRAELGERQVFLDALDRVEAVQLLSGAPSPAGRTRRLPDHGRSSAGFAPAPVSAPAPASAPAPGSVKESAPTYDPVRSLRVLAEDASGCMRCGLAHTRTQVVFGDGTAAADVVVVGEAPGADEDRTGVPFVGRAGKMLDLLLESVGFPRERVYICNVIKCRPPGHRDPQPDEVAQCNPWLRRQIELIQPRVLLAVGRFAAQTLTGTDAPMARLRGRVHAYEGVPVVATYHPAYLLRSPGEVRKCWDDLQLLRRTYDGR